MIPMLAVIEHLEPGHMIGILKKIFRILKINGLFILTTPTNWTDPLLKAIAKLGLVSKIEIDEHKYTYTHRKLVSLLQLANFSKYRIKFGYFEMFSNLWLVANKQPEARNLFGVTPSVKMAIMVPHECHLSMT
jgi:hypothetical protein